MSKAKQTTWNNNVWGIVNAEGKPWTDQVFGSEDAATAYLKNYKLHYPGSRLGQHKAVPVSVTVRVISKKK